MSAAVVVHDLTGVLWRADAERTASYFPVCACGWVGTSVSARIERGVSAQYEYDEHVALA